MVNMSPLLCLIELLFSGNSTCRTYGFAGTAVDASVSNNVLRIAFFNSSRRASASASAAFYAFVRNYMHGFHLQPIEPSWGRFPLSCSIITRIHKNVNEYRFSKP